MSTAISINAPFHEYQYAPFSFSEWKGRAISQEAEIVEQEANTVIDDMERSQALFGEKAAAIWDVRLLAQECREENWDGYGAAATDARAVSLAEYFIRTLPEDFPLPEFAPEPDGSVSLDWAQSRKRVFSLSIGSTNRLAYAWLDGTDKGHGVSSFDGQRIPTRILQGIQEIMKCR